MTDPLSNEPWAADAYNVPPELNNKETQCEVIIIVGNCTGSIHDHRGPHYVATGCAALEAFSQLPGSVCELFIPGTIESKDEHGNWLPDLQTWDNMQTTDNLTQDPTTKLVTGHKPRPNRVVPEGDKYARYCKILEDCEEKCTVSKKQILRKRFAAITHPAIIVLVNGGTNRGLYLWGATEMLEMSDVACIPTSHQHLIIGNLCWGQKWTTLDTNYIVCKEWTFSYGIANPNEDYPTVNGSVPSKMLKTRLEGSFLASLLTVFNMGIRDNNEEIAKQVEAELQKFTWSRHNPTGAVHTNPKMNHPMVKLTTGWIARLKALEGKVGWVVPFEFTQQFIVWEHDSVGVAALMSTQLWLEYKSNQDLPSYDLLGDSPQFDRIHKKITGTLCLN
eukprot:TRINITY_DN104864_c0_g1_i1.p1 TRINITY_DN104864_c0_g1~~TRINITY_DN104864_c0_g1_i1.p1  ORF type:complete len:390 (+),score=22.45 TRINITY_DN104864_c0_g1_i1:21-1190(+)